MKLEKMDAFFTARLDGYDEHMMTEIEGAEEFYPYTAALLPLGHDANVLDLGCGTGLELEYYFTLNGEASVVGIDLSADMLAALKRKFSDRKMEPIFELERLKNEQGLEANAFYHYDTPLTVEHEMEVLKKAGFSDVQILRNWKATYTILAR